MSGVRSVMQNDVADLKKVIDTSGLFPSYLLEGMMQAYFTNPDSEEIWLTQDVQGTPAVIAFCAPEKFTNGTYNLYLIAVHAAHQSKGIGAEVIQYIEDLLRSKGGRVLIVETSGLPEFERTRKFYDQRSFQRIATIPDFYNEGEAKVVFWKKLLPA